jgi:hypothetical protein
MYVVVKIHLESGDMEAFGPFSEKRNAKTAQDWHNGSTLYAAFIVPLKRPANPADATRRGPIQLERAP